MQANMAWPALHRADCQDHICIKDTMTVVLVKCMCVCVCVCVCGRVGAWLETCRSKKTEN